MTTANSYYSRFKELYEQSAIVADELKVLSHDAREAGVEDLATTKRLARLAVTKKLNAEAEKYRKLRLMANQNEQPGLFD